jgi:hypothetical protein
MYKINEIAPDVYRISVFVPEIHLQFNHFLIKDDEPLLYHTGLRKMFPFCMKRSKPSLNPGYCGGSALATSR